MTPFAADLRAWTSPEAAKRYARRCVVPQSTTIIVTLLAAWPAFSFLIGAGRIRQLVGMRVDFDNVAPGILAVDHAIRLLSGIIVTDGHSLLATGRNDLFRQLLDVRICDAEMKDARLPIFKIVFRPDILGKLKQLDTDLVHRRQMADAKARPIGTKHVRTHLPDGAVVLGNGRRGHDRVESQNFGVPLEGGINIRNRQTDVTERARIGH